MKIHVFDELVEDYQSFALAADTHAAAEMCAFHSCVEVDMPDEEWAAYLAHVARDAEWQKRLAELQNEYYLTHPEDTAL